uniref:(California timema) hypothetical protein n=1 Tax=Timema californicum TaxID=61474 RepID=A0A7R9J483_TIMCA|nr:unnamed protein product [Timema californicum]
MRAAPCCGNILRIRAEYSLSQPGTRPWRDYRSYLHEAHTLPELWLCSASSLHTGPTVSSYTSCTCLLLPWEVTLEGGHYLSSHLSSSPAHPYIFVYPYNSVLRYSRSNHLEDQDWGFVAMVLDRLFLWIFTIASIVGTFAILCEAPALYDDTKPIDMELSSVARQQWLPEIEGNVRNCILVTLRCSLNGVPTVPWSTMEIVTVVVSCGHSSENQPSLFSKNTN